MDLLIKAPIEHEPLLNNRFVLYFPSDLGIQTWAVAKCDFPKFNVASKEIDFMNTKNYVQGKFHWESMSITIRDFIGPSQAQAIMEWVRLGSESVTGRQGYAVSYKRNLILERTDPTGVAVSSWEIVEAMVTNVDFGSGDYSDDGITTINIKIQPKSCIMAY